MATVEMRVRELNERRMRVWEEGKAILSRGIAENRGLTAEERAHFDRTNADMNRIQRERDDLIASELGQRELETVNEEYRRVASPDERGRADQRASDILADFFRPLRTPGKYNKLSFDLNKGRNVIEAVRQGAEGAELRAVIATDTGASGGSLTVPSLVAPQVYAYMTASVAMRRTNATIVNTPTGAPMNFPKVATHAIGTQIANQDTAFAGTNPVLGAMTLNAYDFGQLIPVSNDMLQDSDVNVLDYVTSQVARAVGQLTATKYITGSGSGEPNGIETAIFGAGTLASGGSLFGLPAGRELEKLIDLQYSVADSYRHVNGGCSWLMRDLTGAAVRKIRDGAGGTAGQFVWVPSPTAGAIGGQPDTFLGDPVYFDPNIASMASNSKIVYYGNWSAYYIRDVNPGFMLERSDDLYFDKNQAAYRGLIRSDADLVDTAAVNVLKQSV